MGPERELQFYWRAMDALFLGGSSLTPLESPME